MPKWWQVQWLKVQWLLASLRTGFRLSVTGVKTQYIVKYMTEYERTMTTPGRCTARHSYFRRRQLLLAAAATGSLLLPRCCFTSYSASIRVSSTHLAWKRLNRLRGCRCFRVFLGCIAWTSRGPDPPAVSCREWWIGQSPRGSSISVKENKERLKLNYQGSHQYLWERIKKDWNQIFRGDINICEKEQRKT